MAAKTTANFLELKNPHPRDLRIVFDEEACAPPRPLPRVMELV